MNFVHVFALVLIAILLVAVITACVVAHRNDARYTHNNSGEK